MFFLKTMNEKGFTFLNTILDLVVLMMMLPLIVLFYSFFITLSDDLSPKHLEWQLFKEDLQNYLAEVTAIEVIDSGKGIRFVRNGEVYDIETYGNLIRKQVANKGHEVMLTNVHTCRFKVERSLVVVNVTFSDGVSEQVEYAYAYP